MSEINDERLDQKTAFDLLKFGCVQYIENLDAMLYPRWYIEKATDAFYQSIVTGKFLGEACVQRYEFKYPANWWQAFRERWFPEWWLKRHPVEYTHKAVTIDAIYPELHKKIKLPEEKHLYHINVIDE